MKTIIIHHRSNHHALASGYSRLEDYINSKQIPNKSPFLPYRIAKFIGQNCDQELGIYDSNSVKKDFDLFTSLCISKNKYSVVHYLNAERDVRYVVKYSRLFAKTSFCGTFHKPPEILLNTISNTSILQRLNGVIAVGVNQVDFLKEWLKLDNVAYIPHGVDTDFFEPDLKKRQSKTLLFVGQHLRDFKAFNYCIPIIAEKINGLKVEVIIRSDFKEHIEYHECITLHHNVSDLELKLFYQQATALFLPLINVTACNSILEALASGLVIISTDVGGNFKYLDETSNILVPFKDKDYLIEATVALLKDENKILEIGITSRQHSLQFDWSNIANKIMNFYSLTIVD